MQRGYTVLMNATMNRHVDVVQCLVEAGANLEAAHYVSGHVVREYVYV